MRKETRKSLEKKADRLWSLCTIKRDKKCMRCGSKSKLSAHHIRVRQHTSTRWLLHNSITYCWTCHSLQKYRPQMFMDFTIDLVGQTKYDVLRKISERVIKYSIADLREIVESLQRELDG